MKSIFQPIFLLVVLKEVTVYAENNTNMFKVLLERIERLEANDAESKREISSLKSAMNEMKKDFLKREMHFLAEINELKTTLRSYVKDSDSNTSNEDQKGVPARKDTRISMEATETVSKKRRGSLQTRSAVETEVAFYATHSRHDVQHLGQYQIIVFDRDITNIGNAYNSISGAFVAPLDGTYVFHVTMMGKDTHNVTNNHFHAYIDVDGTGYSQLWVEPYKQSSQMFVIELKAGKTVSVKNHVLDDGFIGQHMSTFSGFLLYEHTEDSVVVGK